MKKWISLMLLMVMVSLTCGCVAPGSSGSLPATPTAPAGEQAPPLLIRINASPTRYAPVMSSTIGIRLVAENTSGIFPPGAQFTWETTFGTFYHWGPPDFRVVELAPKYTGTAEPVYWSYFSEHGEKERRPVTITLTVSEPSTGKTLANATLRIGWESPDSFMAVVEGPG